MKKTILTEFDKVLEIESENVSGVGIFKVVLT